MEDKICKKCGFKKVHAKGLCHRCYCKSINYNKYRRDWAKKKYWNNQEFREKFRNGEREKYAKNPELREQRKEYFKKWYYSSKENKEKVYKSVKKNYKENKKRWYSRKVTNDVLKKHFSEIKGFLKKECFFCGSKKRLEFHHEIYPTGIDEIIKAIKEKKIYLLCQKHHRFLHRKK